MGSQWRNGVAGVMVSLAGLMSCGAAERSDTQPVAVNPDAVTTDRGVIRGVVKGKVVQFLGVPYAAAPTGDLRWRAPQSRAAWKGVRDATAPGASCPQAGRGGAGGQTATEDCLFLNVTLPYPVTRAQMPVLVFIHGGGFSGGSGMGIDPTALAQAGNFVVVTPNYRLGIFGYLAHRSLDSGKGDIGNYGLMDQRAALEWVQANIAAFGGNPDSVTLGGNSAGGMSTCNHLVSPASQGLFQRVIVQSGPCAFEWDSLAKKLAAEEGVPAQLGCTGTDAAIAACLRSPSLSIAAALAAGAALPPATLFPSVGGAEVPIQPRAGLGNLPMLLGYNTYEGGVGQPDPADAAAYVAALSTTYGEHAAAIANAYPFASHANGNTAMVAVASDFSPRPGAPQIAVCNNMRTYQLHGAPGALPLYAYEFADPGAPGGAMPVAGPVHTAELNYLFPSAKVTLPATSKTLSEQMLKYWANYVNTGNPNGEGLPDWPVYAGPGSVLKLLPGAVAPYDAMTAHKCSFWQTLGYAL